MNNDIYKLIYLVHIKNGLNRKRRRFYHIINGRYSSKHGKVVRPTHISAEDAGIGYRKAQAEMKAMTPSISALRVELAAQIRWGSGGQVQQVKYRDKWIDARYFPDYHKQAIERAQVDNIILGE